MAARVSGRRFADRLRSDGCQRHATVDLNRPNTDHGYLADVTDQIDAALAEIRAALGR